MNTIFRDKRFQVITTAIVTVVLIARLGYLLINAQNAILDKNSIKTAELRQKIEAAQRLFQLAPKIEADLKENQVKLEAIESKMLLSAGDGYAAMIKLLKDVKPYQVDLVNISQPEFKETVLLPEFPYQSLSFMTRLNTSRQDFTKFLAALENQYPCMQFQFQRLNHARPEEPEILDIELKIIALVLPEVDPVIWTKKFKK